MTLSDPLYRVSVTLDGVHHNLLVAGADEEAVRATLRADYRSGGISSYETGSGIVHIRWGKLSRIGPMTIEPT